MRYNGSVYKLPPYFAVLTFLCSSNMQKSCVTVIHNVTTDMQYIRSHYHTITLKHKRQLAPFLTISISARFCIKKNIVFPSDCMSSGEGRKNDKSGNVHVIKKLITDQSMK